VISKSFLIVATHRNIAQTLNFCTHRNMIIASPQTTEDFGTSSTQVRNGNTGEAEGPLGGFWHISGSADGDIYLANIRPSSGGQTYISTDSGETWDEETDAPANMQRIQCWHSKGGNLNSLITEMIRNGNFTHNQNQMLLRIVSV
jgi:hypothetical protein